MKEDIARACASTVLITGGYGGIGAHAARAIYAAMPNSVLLIAGRNARQAQRFAQSLGRRAEALELDLADLAAVDRCSTRLSQDIRSGLRPPIAVLVCNAGVQSAAGKTEFTVDGYERSFAVNHLGHFHLVRCLLSSMQSPRSRLIVVSSGTHDPSTLEGRFNPPLLLNAEQLAHPPRQRSAAVSSIRRYSTSKLCNLLFAYELHRRYGGDRAPTSLDVIAFDPGAVPSTGLLRDMPRIVKAVIAWPPLLRLLGVRVESAEAAGRSLARLATDPSLVGQGGKYFGGDMERRSSKQSYNTEDAAQLWSGSELLIDAALARRASTTPTDATAPGSAVHSMRSDTT